MTLCAVFCELDFDNFRCVTRTRLKTLCALVRGQDLVRHFGLFSEDRTLTLCAVLWGQDLDTLRGVRRREQDFGTLRGVPEAEV